MTKLLSPLTLRGLNLKNRIVVSPMCQYTVRDGLVGDYHLVHLGRFALGGFGTVIAEATAVTAEGRITYGCPGLWHDGQIEGWSRAVAFVHAQGAVAGIQLAHSGRKGSTLPPWLIGTVETEAGASQWQPVAPSALPHTPLSPIPREIRENELGDLVAAFAQAARRALSAGFDFVEIHAAHGYLLNQFLSPLANRRQDGFGGTRENRMRLPLMVIEAVREVWPSDRPLFLRLSAEDGIAGGITIEDSIAFAAAAARAGVDVVDVSAGGFDGSRFEIGPGMYLPWSEAIRRRTGVTTMAVGLIAGAELAERALLDGKADLVAIGRGALDDPNWALHAARTLGSEHKEMWPRQAGYAIDRWPGRQKAAAGLS